MAPEQLKGEAVTRMTDVFAASIVLWETLTGTRLFSGDSEGHVVAKVLQSAIMAPSELVQGLGDKFDALVLKGLERDPTMRFPSAREMAQALAKVEDLADAAEIGEWLEQVAHLTLQERAERVADVESASSLRLGSCAATTVSTAPPVEPDRVDVVVDGADATTAELSRDYLGLRPSRRRWPNRRRGRDRPRRPWNHALRARKACPRDAGDLQPAEQLGFRRGASLVSVAPSDANTRRERRDLSDRLGHRNVEAHRDVSSPTEAAAAAVAAAGPHSTRQHQQHPGASLKARKASVSILVLAAIVCASPAARAQGDAAPVAPVASSDELKRKGDEALDQKRYEDALGAYEAAYALSPTPVLLYNRGRALQFLARYPEALDMIERFAEKAPPELKARVRGLADLLSDLRSKVSTITVNCETTGARVLVDSAKSARRRSAGRFESTPAGSRSRSLPTAFFHIIAT